MGERLLTELSFQSYLRGTGQPSTLGKTAAQARHAGFSQAECSEAILFGLQAARTKHKEYNNENV